MRGIGLSLIVLWTAAGCYGYPGDPGLVAQAFWNASRAGKLEQARRYLTESGAAYPSPSQTARDPALAVLSIGEIEIDGDHATVTTVIAHSPGDSSLEIVFATRLVREPSGWKVDLATTADNILIGVLTRSKSHIARL